MPMLPPAGRRLVLASNNAKKIAELRACLAPLGLDVVAQGELGVPEAQEPFETFLENALAKARHAARHTGLPALADDSGLCVRALQGAPGVRSARFARDALGAQAVAGREDAANNELLVERLQGQTDRRAQFVCVLVAVQHADDPTPLVAMGRWNLTVLDTPRGEGGFGYDPLVQAVGFEQSVAAMPAAMKNQCSHRAQALQALQAALQSDWL